MWRTGSHDSGITNHTEASVWYQNGQFSKSLSRVAQTFLAMVWWRHNGRSGRKPKQSVTYNAEPLPMDVKWFSFLSLYITSNRYCICQGRTGVNVQWYVQTDIKPYITKRQQTLQLCFKLTSTLTHILKHRKQVKYHDEIKKGCYEFSSGDIYVFPIITTEKAEKKETAYLFQIKYVLRKPLSVCIFHTSSEVL